MANKIVVIVTALFAALVSSVAVAIVPVPAQQASPVAQVCIPCCTQAEPCKQATAKPKAKKVHHKKPAIKKPIPVVAPVVVPATVIASVPKVAEGCVEIHFTTMPGDTAVRFPIIVPPGSTDDIAAAKCTGIKRAGDADFGPWINEFCPKAPTWVCDFENTEVVSGKKVLLMGSYMTKPGEHILRLPGYFAEELKGYVAVLSLIRGGEDTYPPETVSTEFKAAYAYGSQRRNWLVAHSTDAMGVRWFDYPLSTKVATVYYTKEESELHKFAAKLYFPKWGDSTASN